MFAAGDVLGVFGHETPLREFAERFALELSADLHAFAEALSPTHAGIAELVLPPRSSLVGKTMRELKFRRRYRATLLAIHRAPGRRSRSGSPMSPCSRATRSSCTAAGETSRCSRRIAISSWSAMTRNRTSLCAPSRRGMRSFFLLSLSLVLFLDIRLSLAFMAGAIGVVVSGVLRIDETYQAVDWRTVFLLASLIPLGLAVEQSGTAAWIAAEVLARLGDVPAWVLLTAIVVLATAFTLLMSNVGATVLPVPLSIEIALGAGADPRVFALAVDLAASHSFLLPTHQVNALIMGGRQLLQPRLSARRPDHDPDIHLCRRDAVAALLLTAMIDRSSTRSGGARDPRRA